MIHQRSAMIGAALGSALTFMTMGFIACQKSDNTNSANAQGKTPVTGAKPGAPALPPQSPGELGESIAKIDDFNLTVGDFQDRINKQSPYVRARYTSLEQKKEFLDNLIRFEVLAKEAKKRGYDQDPEVVRTMKQVMIQRLMKEEFETRVKQEDVTDAEMKKFYDEHTSEYNKAEEVRVSAIIVKDRETADKAAAEAKGPTGQDNKGFRDMVTKYSQDEETKARGGDLRFFAADTKDLPPEVVKAAFELQKPGDVAGPVAAGGKFYILKQTGRRKSIAKSFDEVKRQIQNRIYRDKRQKAMDDFVKNLRDTAKIEISEDKLAKVRIDTSMPAPVPGESPHGMPMPGAPGNPPPGVPVPQ
jgi:peptidyl-prolyl cis-trans isomerase C